MKVVAAMPGVAGPAPARAGRALIVLLPCLLVAACAALPRLNAVPSAIQERATIPGIEGARYWADRDPAEFLASTMAAFRREQDYLRTSGHRGPLPPAEFLAISGGGENGAFGAGLLVGWTAAGTRPQFKAVTGISTGALTAPFAFLGPAYDARLREVYTTISAADVLQPRGYLAALFQDALADSTPLRRTIGRYVDQALLDAIAAEHAKGRVLLIGTTNLDARQPVIWNIGEIAASGGPGALRLVQDILVASSAVPAAFPPVMIDVEVDGRHYQEMHVDGGTSAQVFIYPPSIDIHQQERRAGLSRERRLYLVRNARLDPDWAQVERRTLSIASRAVSSLIQTQGVGDIYRIYLAAQRDGIDFNLAYIPETFKTVLKAPFDTAYMKELFQLGYELGAAGYPWAKAPPGYTLPNAPVSSAAVSAPPLRPRGAGPGQPAQATGPDRARRTAPSRRSQAASARRRRDSAVTTTASPPGSFRPTRKGWSRIIRTRSGAMRTGGQADGAPCLEPRGAGTRASIGVRPRGFPTSGLELNLVK